MFPILARYGEIFVYSYTILLALGILSGIGLTAWRERGASIVWFDALLAIIAGAIIGGRIGFVLFNWSYYQEHMGQIWQFSQGGFNYHLALLGGVLALLLWSSVKNSSFYQIFAKLAPAFLLFTVFAWAACWFEGCAYGRPTIIGPLSADLPDEFGVFAVRFQTQLIGLFLSIFFFLLILAIANKMKPRTLFWFTIAAVSFIHLITSLMRGDPSPTLAYLRLDTWADLLIIALSVVLIPFTFLIDGAKLTQLKEEIR